MHKLYQNQSTRTSTKYGLTKKIQLANGLSRGKTLSGTEFGALMDDVEVELVAEGLGIKYGYLTDRYINSQSRHTTAKKDANNT